MTRLKDIVSGTNTLMGAADLAIVHVGDVAAAHAKCMLDDSAHGRYLIATDMVTIEDVFATLSELYPDHPVAALKGQNIASGVKGAARKVDSARTLAELGELKGYKVALKDAVDSLIEKGLVQAAA